MGLKHTLTDLRGDPGGFGVMLVLVFFLAISLGVTVYTVAGAIKFAAVDSGWFQSAEEAAASQPASAGHDCNAAQCDVRHAVEY